MKKIIIILMWVLLLVISISCSSDDSDSNNNLDSENNFTLGTNTYEITNAYLVRNDLGNSSFYSIFLTNGEIVDYNSNDALYSNDFQYVIGFTVRTPNTLSSLPNDTFNYDIDGNSSRYLSSIGFSNQYVIENNEVQSFNTVLNQNDIVNEEARIIINELNNGDYNFNFNAITTLGQFNGSYTGLVEVIE